MSYALRHGCSWADAEDAIQEVWLKLARTGRLQELTALSTDEQLGKLKMRLRCAIIRQRSGAVSHVPLDDLDQAAPGPCPGRSFDLARLREVLTAAGIPEGQKGLSGAARVALHRKRVALRPLLAHWRD